jgi:hypothetical protein
MGSMSDLDGLIEQMVVDIGTQVFQLDDPRLKMFLDWLTAHSVEMNRSIGIPIGAEKAALRGADMQERFQSALKDWLRSLPVQSLLWEYKTVTAEIVWWRTFDMLNLKMILKSSPEE